MCQVWSEQSFTCFLASCRRTPAELCNGSLIMIRLARTLGLRSDVEHERQLSWFNLFLEATCLYSLMACASKGSVGSSQSLVLG